MVSPTLIWLLPLAAMVPLSAAAAAAAAQAGPVLSGQLNHQNPVLKGRQFGNPGGNKGLGRGLDPDFMPPIDMTGHEGAMRGQQRGGSFFDNLGVPDLFRPLSRLKPDDKRRSSLATRDATAQAAQTTPPPAQPSPNPSSNPVNHNDFDEAMKLRSLQRHSHRISPKPSPSSTAAPTTTAPCRVDSCATMV